MNGNTKKLTLSLKKKWFEMTKSGIKTEDYREITPYWCNRLLNNTYQKTYNKEFWKELIKDENQLYKRLKYIIYFTGEKKFKTTTLTLGYPKSTDTDRIIKFEHLGIEIRTGNPEWGAEEGKLYFVVKHGKQIN